jgi:hypothetical protein
LPNLRSTPLTQGAQHITRALGDLVNIQQRALNDEAQHRTAQSNKLPSGYFQGGLIKLMRWCHVGAEQNLPDVYTQLANSAKGQHRRVLQAAAMDEACERLNYHYHNIQVTTSVARKIVDLEWISTIQDNLSTGFHHFTIGYVSEDEAHAQLLRNQEPDLLHAGTAAPSLSDTKSLLANDEVHIPLSTLQGRITHERMHVFWDVLLGSAHPLTVQQRTYARTYASREIELETITPRDPRQFYLVPALLTRRPQLATSYWIRQQARSDDNLPISNLVDVFDKIAQGKDWAPVFPARYLKQQIPKVTLDIPTD